MDEQLLRAAMACAAKGIAVFPCQPRGKKPLSEHGCHDATTSQPRIRQWWTEHPAANIGVATGAASGIVVLDVDGPEGEAALAELEAKHGKLPATLAAYTGRQGGRHLYFTLNGASVRNSAGKLGPHLDMRGEGGYVIVPPSVHPSGKRYEWVDPHVKPAPLPAWFAALLVEPIPTQTESKSEGGKIPEGQRNTELTSLAGAMRRKGATESAIVAGLLAENNTRCDPPLPEAEVKKIAQSMTRYEPVGSPNQPTGTWAKGFSLVTLGQLLAQPEAPTDWVWRDHFAVGTVVGVVSKPKVGKSTFARNLCLAVARGDDFLGSPVKRGLCIYLALEERKEEVTADFRAMGATEDDSILIHADTAPAAGILALITLVEERKPVLVVIDPLFRMIQVKEEKAYAEMYAALGPLIDLARNTGTLILFTHHAGKSAKVDLVDSPLGSTAIAGCASTTVVLKRTENYRTVASVQRFGCVLPETVLALDPDSRLLSLGVERGEADTALMAEKVLTFLESAEEAKGEREITEGVEGRTTIVRKALRQSVRQGKINREGKGTKRNPYRYSKCLFACSPPIVGTRKQESEMATGQENEVKTQNACSVFPYSRGNKGTRIRNGADTRENTSQILVPDKPEKPILVPETKAAIPAVENSAEGHPEMGRKVEPLTAPAHKKREVEWEA